MSAFRVITILLALVVSSSHATFFDKDKGSSHPVMPHVIMLPPIVDYQSFHHRPHHGFDDTFHPGGWHGHYHASDNKIGWLPHKSYLDAMKQTKFGSNLQSTNFDTKIFQHNQVFPQTQIFPQPIIAPVTNVFPQPQSILQPQFIPQPQLIPQPQFISQTPIVSTSPVYQPNFAVDHLFAPPQFYSGPPLIGGDAVAASHYATGLLHTQFARDAAADPKKKGGKIFKKFFKGKKFRSDDEHGAMPPSTFLHKTIHTKQPVMDHFMEAEFNHHGQHHMYRPHHLQKVKEFIFEKGNDGMKMQKLVEFDFSRANQAMPSPVQMLPQNTQSMHMGTPVEMLPLNNMQPMGTPVLMQPMQMQAISPPHHLKKRSINISQAATNSLDEKETEKLSPTVSVFQEAKGENRSCRYIPPPILPPLIPPPILPPLIRPPFLHRPLNPFIHPYIKYRSPKYGIRRMNLAKPMPMNLRRTYLGPGRNYYHSTNYYPGQFIGHKYIPPVRTSYYRFRRSVDNNVTTVAPESSSPRSNDESDQKLETPPVQPLISSPLPAKSNEVNKTQTPPGLTITSAMLPRHFQPHHQLMHGEAMMHMQPAYHPHAFHPGFAPVQHLGHEMQHGIVHNTFHTPYPMHHQMIHPQTPYTMHHQMIHPHTPYPMHHQMTHPMHHGHLMDPRVASPTHFVQPQPPVHIHVDNSHPHPSQSHHFSSSSQSHFNDQHMGHTNSMGSPHFNGHHMGYMNPMGSSHFNSQHMNHMDSSHHFFRENAAIQQNPKPMFFPPIQTFGHPQFQS